MEDDHSETAADARDSDWKPEGESFSDHSTVGMENLWGKVPRKSRHEYDAPTQTPGAQPRRCPLHGCPFNVPNLRRHLRGYPHHMSEVSVDRLTAAA